MRQVRARLANARRVLTLAGAALLIGAALFGPAPSLLAQEPVGTVAADGAVLMALYAATDGPNWTDNANWGSDAPLGDWHGVSVNAEGRITGLQLKWNNLTGTLPPALGDLTALEDLDLSYNQLHGPVFPPWLADLRNLRELRLGRNQFSGPIPPELGNFTNLRTLSLSYNQLSGEIPPELGNLINLRTLGLSYNKLSGEIPPELGNLINLGELHLISTLVRGTIPPELGNLTRLWRLFLAYNQLHGPIPAALGNLANLRELWLYDNQLRGPIPPELGNLPNLRKLLLFSNQLSGRIPAALGRLTQLRQLWMSGNRLSGPIPPELGNLALLRELLLGHNQLSGPVPEELSDLPHLQAISLRGNLAECLPGALLDRLSTWDLGFPGQSLRFCLLRDLQLSGATLDPAFAADTDAYAAAVSGPVESIVVGASPRDANDTVTIRKGARTYANGTAVPLVRGTNLITVEVGPPAHTSLQRVTVTVTRSRTDPIALPFRAGGDLVVMPVGVATTAADLFGGTDVTSAWQYNRATRAWDRSYLPARGRGGFAIAGGDVLWVVSPENQTLIVEGTPQAPALDPGPITLVLQKGGDLVVVPAGAPTTTADLFGGTDVTSAWQYNRATRAWDRSYLPARSRGGFAIAGGDVLWVVTPRAQTITDKGALPAQGPDPAVKADRAALMTLYDATNGPFWGVNTNWGSDTPLGTWHGVTTDADGRVIRLSLYLNQLSGPLPTALGHLANLRRLDLSSNQLSGPAAAACPGLSRQPIERAAAACPATTGSVLQPIERAAAACPGPSRQPGDPGSVLQPIERAAAACPGPPRQPEAFGPVPEPIERADPGRPG